MSFTVFCKLKFAQKNRPHGAPLGAILIFFSNFENLPHIASSCEISAF